MKAIVKKVISTFSIFLGIIIAILGAITLRFAIWKPELLQEVLHAIFV